MDTTVYLTSGLSILGIIFYLIRIIDKRGNDIDNLKAKLNFSESKLKEIKSKCEKLEDKSFSDMFKFDDLENAFLKAENSALNNIAEGRDLDINILKGIIKAQKKEIKKLKRKLNK